MEINVNSLTDKSPGTIAVSPGIFCLDPREDIIHRVIKWQLDKARAGTHKVKNRDEIARTGKKLYKQKGTGGARHGSARVVQFRGGGRAFGPVVRSHAHDLPKKVRALGVKHALSSKFLQGHLMVLDTAEIDTPKTKELKQHLDKLGITSALIIDGVTIQENFQRAASNIPCLDVLPAQGINVYDIIRCEKLILTKAALKVLEARFS